MSKRALLVGVNEFKDRPNWQLQGCVNDTIAMHDLLTAQFRFDDAGIRVLKNAQATRKGIQDGLAWLLSGYEGKGKDVRVFHFSSHGTQVDDQGDDKEWDGFDEVIVPYDHDWDNPFRDDDLRAIFAPIPTDVNFTFVADCCHSGSIQRKLWESKIKFKPRFVPPPRDIDRRIRALQDKRDKEEDAWIAAQLEEMMKTTPLAQITGKLQEYIAQLRKRFRENRYAVVQVDRHILLAACEDRQTAADAEIEGVSCGAFTWGLVKAVKAAKGALTYEQLIKGTAANLKGFDQKPQLECPAKLRKLNVFSPLA